MINFWYQLDWKIQYATTIVLIIVVLQLGTITFYTNTDRKKYIQSEENDRKNKIIKNKIKENNIEEVNYSLKMKQKAIEELYLTNNDLDLGEVETIEAFENRSNIINYNLQKIKNQEQEGLKSINKNNKVKKYNFKINFFNPKKPFNYLKITNILIK